MRVLRWAPSLDGRMGCPPSTYLQADVNNLKVRSTKSRRKVSYFMHFGARRNLAAVRTALPPLPGLNTESGTASACGKIGSSIRRRSLSAVSASSVIGTFRSKSSRDNEIPTPTLRMSTPQVHRVWKPCLTRFLVRSKQIVSSSRSKLPTDDARSHRQGWSGPAAGPPPTAGAPPRP
jgi:hypothetical protein